VATLDPDGREILKSHISKTDIALGIIISCLRLDNSFVKNLKLDFSRCRELVSVRRGRRAIRDSEAKIFFCPESALTCAYVFFARTRR